MNRMSKWAVAVLLVALLALVGAGCGGDDGNGETTTAAAGEETEVATPEETEEVELMLPFQDSIAWTGYEIARQEFYPPMGMDVSTLNADGDSYVSQQLIAGKVDFAIGGAAETIVANAQGHELISIANVNADIFTIVAAPDSGVTSVADLEGKALGVTDLGGGEMPLVEAVLRSADLERDSDVELKVVGPGGPAAAKALQDGQIAAYAGATNDIAAMQVVGIELEPILSDEFSGLPSNELLVRPELLDDPDGLQTVINIAAGWFDGLLLARDEPDRGFEITCSFVPVECQDEEVGRAFFDVTLEGAVPQAEVAGEHHLDKYEVVADSIVGGTDVEGVEDLDLEAIFSNEYTDQIRAAMTR